MNIHVISDSHSGAFTRRAYKAPNSTEIIDEDIPPFITHYIAGATAYHLKDNQSSSNSNVHLGASFNEVKPSDIVLLWFGEIDCRLHLAQKSKEKGIPVDTLIDQTIESYAYVLKMVEDKKLRWAVIGVPPCNIEGGFPVDEKKKYIYFTFNEKLYNLCVKNNYKYIDAQERFADDKGFIKPKYLRSTNTTLFGKNPAQNRDHENDCVHLNHRIIPDILEQINNLFDEKLYISIGS